MVFSQRRRRGRRNRRKEGRKERRKEGRKGGRERKLIHMKESRESGAKS